MGYSYQTFTMNSFAHTSWTWKWKAVKMKDMKIYTIYIDFNAFGGICVSQTHLVSAPEPKAQVHYCDHALSVHPSVVRPSLTFHIFDFSSETAEQNSRKVDRKQYLNVLYQVCVFWADLIGWDIFNFSETAERNSTKVDKKQDLTQCPLPSLCFSGQSQKQDGRPSLWLTSPLKLLNGIQRNLTERRSQRPLPSLCFSVRSEKQDGRPDLWLAETFSTSPLKRLNGIQRKLTGSKIRTSTTKFVFFRQIRKTRWTPWPLIGRDIFQLLLWNCWTEFNETWQEATSQCPLQCLHFSGGPEKQDWSSGLWLAETFSTFPLKPLNRIQWNSTGSKVLMSSTKFFRADWKNKMAALASDWLIHFWLLLWNRWMEFNENWQEARSQRHYQVCVFRVDWKNKMAALASDWLRHFRLLL